jgi:anti-sigma factor (TIGR02949 family)
MRVVSTMKIHPKENLCEKSRGLMDAYLSNELSAESTLEVAGHLKHCSGCASDYGARKEIKAALKKAVNRQETCPADLQQKILRELRLQKKQDSWRLH